jgi:hypothetical protein
VAFRVCGGAGFRGEVALERVQPDGPEPFIIGKPATIVIA